LPIKNTSKLTEVLRKRVIKYFVDNGLLDNSFARNLLSWKHYSATHRMWAVPARPWMV